MNQLAEGPIDTSINNVLWVRSITPALLAWIFPALHSKALILLIIFCWWLGVKVLFFPFSSFSFQRFSSF